MGVDSLTEYTQYGGPCQRQCDIDKKTLINEINVIKSYPLVQIYSALTQLVDDKTEFITDKYDRLGHLVNIDDLYLFEPLELKDSNISLYERKVPIPYKHNKLSINLKSVILRKIL